MDSALSALLLTGAVWTLLLGAAALRPALGEASTLLGVAAAGALVALLPPRPRVRSGLAAPLLAGAAGLLSLPAWLAALAALGGALGLPHGALPAAPGPLRSACDVGPLPLLEELLYRARLLPALRAPLGAPLALLLSSALFALPHADAWGRLAAFGIGLVLGGAFLATRSVALCAGYHAGVNLAAAALLRGRYPPLPLAISASAAWLLFGAALLRARTVGPPA